MGGVTGPQSIPCGDFDFFTGSRLITNQVEAARPSCSLVKHIDQYADRLFDTQILNSLLTINNAAY